MNESERHEILQQLQDGWNAVAGALDGVDESQARCRPQPESWSVLDCLEHISASEAFLLSRLRQAEPQNTSHEDRAREAKLAGLALNRERRIDAPAPVRPTGDCATLADAVRAFAAVRAETVRFVEQFCGDLRFSLVVHPLITRPLNCYEMLMLMALHPKRHAEQILETKRSLA